MGCDRKLKRGLSGDFTGTSRGLHGDFTGTSRGLRGDFTGTSRLCRYFSYKKLLGSRRGCWLYSCRHEQEQHNADDAHNYHVREIPANPVPISFNRFNRHHG